MKKLLFTLIAALMIFSGCNKQFKINLNLDNADGKTAYLFKDVNGQTVDIDNAVIQDGKAELKADFDDPQTLYMLKFDQSTDCEVFPFFTENQNTTISGEMDDMAHWTIQGCPAMNDYNDFHQQSLKDFEEPIMALYGEMGEAYQANDTLRAAEINDQLKPLIEGYFDNQIEYIRNHPDSYIAHHLLNEMKAEMEFSTVKELAESFTNESVYSKQVKEYIEKNGRVDIGQPFIDFTLKTAEGEDINLETVINNNRLVLVDFWASWCGPCRGENPYVKAAYEKYHAAGLQIIGVSVDRDEAAWLKAVEDDGLTWIQVRDIDSKVATEYMVQYIPSNFLFDANGVIIAKGLRGEELEAKLAEVLQ